MYNICKFLENIVKYFKIKIKIMYWKIKYGKRIKIGKNLHFRKGFIINISKDGYLEIGDNNFFNNYCSINCRKKIIIGNNNLFGENVKIYDHSHVFNNRDMDIKKNFVDGKITIGDNNWIASNVVILKKTDLGSENVIANNVIVNEQYTNNLIIKNNAERITNEIVYKGEKK